MAAVSIGNERWKKASLSQRHLPRLTRIEREVMGLLLGEFLTPVQIALRRGCSISRVYAIIKSIRSKGYIGIAIETVENLDPTIQQFLNPPQQAFNSGVRLHGQHFTLQLLHQMLVYDELRKKSNVQYINGHTVKLHRRVVEVIAGSGVSFFGEDAASATAKSMPYWTSFFQRLESLLGVPLVKSRALNIKQVGAHYALVRNGLARECRMTGDKIRVYARDDGRLWFTIDNSFNLDEAETLHPETGELDMQQAVAPFFNDLRDRASRAGEIVTLSEIMLALKEQAAVNRETAAGLNAVVQLMRPPKEAELAKPAKPERPSYVG